MWTTRTATFIALTTAVAATTADGQVVRDWTNPAGGAFLDPGNWLPAGVPQLLDTAAFDLIGTYTVTFSSDVQHNKLSIDDDIITFELGGFTYALDEAVIGDHVLKTGSLTINNGTLSVGTLETSIGKDPSSSGTLIIPATGMFVTSSNVKVGDDGTGTLQVMPGGSLSANTTFIGDNPSGVGMATITGPGATWFTGSSLIVGNDGDGTFTASGGASITSNSIGKVGDNFGSVGHLLLTGNGTTWTTGTGYAIGNEGMGTVDVLSGADLIALTGITRLAVVAGSSGTINIDGAGSSLISNLSGFTIGSEGIGILSISNGGTAVFGGDLNRIGNLGAGNGTLNVTGAGSSLSAATETAIGNFGTGTMNVLAGGSVTTALTKVGDELGGNGTVNVDGAGSTWTISSQLIVGNRGTALAAARNGGAINAAFATLGDDFFGAGTLEADGAGSVVATTGALTNGNFGNGTLRVSDGGVVNVGSTYSQTANGSMEIVLGSSSGAGPMVNVAGGAQIAGTLTVTVEAGFTPAGTVTLLGAGSVTGTFGGVSLPPDGALSYEAGAVVLTFPGEPCIGDINDDTVIDVTDLLLLLASWGQIGVPADLDGGGVGVTDLLLLLSAWGPCP